MLGCLCPINASDAITGKYYGKIESNIYIVSLK